VNDPRPAQYPSTALQVPTPADLVVAPTPQDRALVVAEHLSCDCLPAAVPVVGHLDGCPSRGTP
jgi:hypothetical protein